MDRTSPRQWRGETVNRYIPVAASLCCAAQIRYSPPAIQTGSNILPVALIGTERVYANMLKLRRTPVTILGGLRPLQIDPPCAACADNVSTSCRT